MRVLLIGSGGREHALAWKLKQSKLIAKLYTWPGSPSIDFLSERLSVPQSISKSDYLSVARVAHEAEIDLVVCGPETALAQGLANIMIDYGIPTFGPIKEAAELESSKAFAKEIMREGGIPTADFELATSEDSCREKAFKALQEKGAVVLKASGLAAGKGVFVCRSKDDIENGLSRLYSPAMKEASETVVIDDLLVGRECSYFALLGTNPKSASGRITPLGFAVDYKRLKDQDEGPNTGGMGGYCPVPWLPDNAADLVHEKILEPLLKVLDKRNLPYCGFIYVGIMWCSGGPRVFEFNVRLGDPETQSLVLRDHLDWLAIIADKLGLRPYPHLAPKIQAISGSQRSPNSSSGVEDAISARKVVSVVMASRGYPYGEGDENITPQTLPAALFEAGSSDIKVFGASLVKEGGRILTGKGRVLTVTGAGETFADARSRAYEKVKDISRSWTDAQWRSDIAQNL